MMVEGRSTPFALLGRRQDGSRYPPAKVPCDAGRHLPLDFESLHF